MTTPGNRANLRRPRPVAAAEVWRTQLDEAVYGVVTVIGNAVLTCPTTEQAGPNPQTPTTVLCGRSNHEGHGPAALNNGHRMSWTDVGDDPRTFNSSSAKLSPARSRAG